MRILITGDRYWPCHLLARPALRRLVAKYGTDITIIHGGSEGVEEAFAIACERLEVRAEPHLADWDDLSHPDARIMVRFDGTKYDANAGPRRTEAMIASGADMCLAFHRNLAFSRATKDCARRAIAAGIATWLIESTLGNLVPLKAQDPRLK